MLIWIWFCCLSKGSRSCRRRLSAAVRWRISASRDVCRSWSRRCVLDGTWVRRGSSVAASWASFRASTASVLARLPVASGEAPRLPGVHLRQRQLRFGQRFLEVPVVGAGGLVRDALDRSSDPIDQRPEAGRVIVELGGMAVGQPVRVQVRFRDVDAYGMLFHLSCLLCLSFGP